MKIKHLLLTLLIGVVSALPASAQDEEEHKCSDNCCCAVASPSIPPISVMGEHLHHKGGWMVSYRYRNSQMEGLKSGINDISDIMVYNSYMMSPTDMKMQGHMIAAMYGLTDNVTIMAMIPYMKVNMGMSDMMGMTSTMNSSGIGDASISAIFRLWSKNNTQLLLNAGVGIPTGTKEGRGKMGVDENALLPYSMQLGSGSWSVLPGFTFTHTESKFTIGLQASANVKINNNSLGYQLGDVYKSDFWLAYRLHDIISISTGLNAQKTGQISGKATELNMMMPPMANAINYGATLVSGNLGNECLCAMGKVEKPRIRIGIQYTYPSRC